MKPQQQHGHGVAADIELAFEGGHYQGEQRIAGVVGVFEGLQVDDDEDQGDQARVDHGARRRGAAAHRRGYLVTDRASASVVAGHADGEDHVQEENAQQNELDGDQQRVLHEEVRIGVEGGSVVSLQQQEVAAQMAQKKSEQQQARDGHAQLLAYGRRE